MEEVEPHSGSRPWPPGNGGGAVSAIGVVENGWVLAGPSRSRTSIVDLSLHETMSCRESPLTSYTMGRGSGWRSVMRGLPPTGSETAYGNVNKVPPAPVKVPLP